MRRKPFEEVEDGGSWPFSRDHRIVGLGSPIAEHWNEASSPCKTFSELGSTEMIGAVPGATKIPKKKKKVKRNCHSGKMESNLVENAVIPETFRNVPVLEIPPKLEAVQKYSPS